MTTGDSGNRKVEPASRAAPAIEQDSIHDYDDESIEVLPVINLLLRKRGLILKPAALLALAVGLFTLTLPPAYTATATFISSGSAGSASAALGREADADLSLVAGLTEYYQALLQSDEFLKSALKRQYSNGVNKPPAGLGAAPPDEQALEALVGSLKAEKRISIEKAKASSLLATILMLKVSGRDPELARQMASNVLAELSAYGGDARTQKAIKDRDFIQDRLNETAARLRSDEAALAHFSMRNRKIVTPDLENEKTRLQRSVSVQEGIFLDLGKELEAAKIKVQENSSVLQVLEQPVSLKTGPKRRLYLMLAFFFGLLFFSARIIVRDWWSRLDDSNIQERELVQHLMEIREESLGAPRSIVQYVLSAAPTVVSRIQAYRRRLRSRRA